MSKQGHIEEQEFIVKEFLWVDGEYSCSSGKLLNILDKLANAESVGLEEDVQDYLSKKGLIVESGEAYKVAEGKAYACITLGNNISRAITRKLSELKPEEVEYITKIPDEQEK